jgi:hypothetical protein
MKPRRPTNYFFRKHATRGLVKVFVSPTTRPKAATRAPNKLVTPNQLIRPVIVQSKLDAYLARLRKPVKAKVVSIPEKKEEESWRDWHINNGVAIGQNWKASRAAQEEQRLNTAKAVITEEIQAVLMESPLIKHEDLKLQVFKRVRANHQISTMLTTHALSPSAIYNHYRELLKIGIIKRTKQAN